MMRNFTVGVAALAAALLVVSGAMAQSRTAQPATDKAAPMEQKASPMQPKAGPGAEQPKMGQLEGKIRSVDSKGVVTLEDGTKLMIPKSVAVPKDKLKPGALITAEYQEKDGHKVATVVQIRS